MVPLSVAAGVAFVFAARAGENDRGKLEESAETIRATRAGGKKSARMTENLGPDKIRVTDRIVMPDGSMLKGTGEGTRVKRPRIED